MPFQTGGGNIAKLAYDESQEAKQSASTAITSANEANAKSDFTQKQLDQVAGASTIDPAVEQMKVDTEGTTHASPDARLRSDYNKVTSQLAQKANKEDVANLVSGTPLFANSVQMMADTTKPYVNTTDGLIYLYNSGTSTFENTGVKYQSTGIAEKSVSPIHTTFVKIGKNKFNGVYIPNRSIAGPVGAKKYEVSSNGYYCAVVNVKPNTKYAISKKGGDRFRIASSVGYPVDNTPVARDIFTGDGNTQINVTTQSNEDYLIIYVTSPSSTLPTQLQVEEGEVVTPYTKQKFVIDLEDKSIKKEMLDDGIIKDTVQPFKIATTVNEDFVNIGSLLPIEGENAQQYISRFDNEVRNVAPDYIAKQTGATTPLGTPIYRYNFIPPLPVNNQSAPGHRKPKVLFIIGLHGHERKAIYSGLSFFKELVTNWQSNTALEFLRWNVDISVVTLANPDGFNANTRQNSNGVDLNSNFPARWESNTDPYSNSGASPASEKETQYIISLMNEGFDLIIDHHQYAGLSSNDHAFYFCAEDEKTRNGLSAMAMLFNGFLRKQYPTITNDNVSRVRVSGGVDSDKGKLYVEGALRGIPTILLETGVSTIPNTVDTDDLKVQHFGSEVAGNLLVKCIQHYDWLI